MRGSRRAIALTAICLATVLPTQPANTAAPSAAERLRALFSERMRALGSSPQRLFSSPATITVWDEHGPRTATRPFGEVVSGLGDVSAPIAAGEGPYGTPEVVAGNITDIFGGAWFGPDDDADENCSSINVQRSATAPNTYDLAQEVAEATGVPLVNPVQVTLAPLFLTPIPGALEPVIPSTSWAMPAYTWLGPTLHITGNYDLGLHTVGTLLGSNVSTASGADPYPVWTPMTTTGFVEDRAIDFVGQALFVNANLRESSFGFTVCATVGALVFSNGVAIFDNHPVLGLDLEFPDVP